MYHNTDTFSMVREKDEAVKRVVIHLSDVEARVAHTKKKTTLCRESFHGSV